MDKEKLDKVIRTALDNGFKVTIKGNTPLGVFVEDIIPTSYYMSSDSICYDRDNGIALKFITSIEIS